MISINTQSLGFLEKPKQTNEAKFYFFGGRSYLRPLESMTKDEALMEVNLKFKNQKGLILKAIEEV